MVEDLKENGCSCPYCDEEVVTEAAPFCKPCQVVLRYCGKCRIAVANELKRCPQCGQPLE